MVVRICTQSALVRRFLQSKPYLPCGLQRRHQSSRGHMVEVDLQSVSSADGETEVVGVKVLEEMIHKLMVLKSTPDWLPFLPGSSFWVPPRSHCRSPSDVAQLMVSMATHAHNPSLSFQPRPSSSFLFQGPALRYPSNVGIEEVEEGDDDIEKMLDEVEAEVEILEAQAQAEAEAEAEAEADAAVEAEAEAVAEADAEVEAEADAEAVAEAAAESKSWVATNSRKTPLYENDEG